MPLASIYLKSMLVLPTLFYLFWTAHSQPSAIWFGWYLLEWDRVKKQFSDKVEQKAHKNGTLFNGCNYKLIIWSRGIVFSYLCTSDKAPELGT